jgi:hypothetical protein
VCDLFFALFAKGTFSAAYEARAIKNFQPLNPCHRLSPKW